MAERRPTLTASARAGVRNLRSGRKKACGFMKVNDTPAILRAAQPVRRKLIVGLTT